MIDKIEKEGGQAIVYGNDLHQKEALATIPLIPASLINIVGYFAPPTLNHLHVDSVWDAIGRGIGKLFYMPEIIIEHLHPDAGKAERDETYIEVNDSDRAKQDGENYKKWLNEELPQIINKINK